MARYTLFPRTGALAINGETAFDVDYTGLNPAVHCIQWYDTVGVVEYVFDPITGEKPLNEEITSITPYQSYIDQAADIIYAANNPAIFYSTVSSNTYQGETYDLGAPIEIYTPDPVQPPNTTTFIPPTPETFQSLFWFANAWVISSVDPTLSLPQAQAYLINQSESSGAANANNEARIYSILELITDPNPGLLPTADYFGVDLATYQTYIDGEVAAITAQVNAATTVPALYNLNPLVDPDPN